MLKKYSFLDRRNPEFLLTVPVQEVEVIEFVNNLKTKRALDMMTYQKYYFKRLFPE